MSSPDEQKYHDIIHMPHHVSSSRAQMTRLNRAAQFSPFAALTGYDAVIRETGRLTDRRIELSEEQLAVLDRKQQILRGELQRYPEVSVTYFVPDARKSGGTYVTVSGNVKRIDSHRRTMILTDGTKIPMDDVVGLDSPLFQGDV